MSALTFDKSELGNLEYSLQREMLSTDRMGGYMSTTIVCCNTRMRLWLLRGRLPLKRRCSEFHRSFVITLRLEK